MSFVAKHLKLIQERQLTNVLKPYAVLTCLFVFLCGCLPISNLYTPPVTSLPLLTYAHFQTQFIDTDQLSLKAQPSDANSLTIEDLEIFNETPSEHVERYLKQRFQKLPHETSAQALNPQIKNVVITAKQTLTSNSNIQEGEMGNLESFTSGLRDFLLKSDVHIDVTCSKNKKIQQDISIQKSIHIPHTYSPYQRDLSVIEFIESFVFDLDQNLHPAFIQIQNEC